MLYSIQITFALIGSSLLLAFLTNTFAYRVSQVMEAAFDEIECTLAAREQRRAARLVTRHIICDAPPSARAELSL